MSQNFVKTVDMIISLLMPSNPVDLPFLSCCFLFLLQFTTNQSFWEIEVLGEIFEDLQRLFGEG